MRVSANKRAAVARMTARRDSERAVTVRPVGPVLPAGSTFTDAPRGYWAHLERDANGMPGIPGGPIPTDPATWDAVERRAEAARDARDALAVVTGRAYGSPVRGYRSRKGYTWPGHSPLVATGWHSEESERPNVPRKAGRK